MTQTALTLSALAAVALVPAEAGPVSITNFEPKYAGMSWRKALVNALALPLGVAVYFKGPTYFLVGREANVKVLIDTFNTQQAEVVKASLEAHKADKGINRIPFEREEMARRLADFSAPEALPALTEAQEYAQANLEVAKPKAEKTETKPTSEAPKAEEAPASTEPTETKEPVAEATPEAPKSPTKKFKKLAYAGAE